MLLPRPTVISVVEAFGKRHNRSLMPAFPPNLPGACSNGELRTRTGQRASNTPVTPHPQIRRYGFRAVQHVFLIESRRPSQLLYLLGIWCRLRGRTLLE